MTAVSRPRTHPGLRAAPAASRLLAAYLVSLLLHGLMLAALSGHWRSNAPYQSPPPVYYVDLVHAPVLNPQAGRPEPRVTTPTPTPRRPLAEPPAAVPPKPATVAKPAARPAVNHLSDALQKLRDEQALQQRLATMRRSQAVPADLPVGLPDAKGNEAGVTSLVYVQATIQQNWALSPYLLADPAKMATIEAWVQLTYGKNGRLESYRFERPSGNVQFDESIKRALIKSQQLPVTLPVRLEEVRVVFNLKTMAEARR